MAWKYVQRNDTTGAYRTTDQGGGGGGDSAHNYYTTEQEMGEWIDGETYYELTVDLGTIGTAGNNNISVPALAGIVNLIDIQCVGYSSYFNQWYHIPNIHSDMSKYAIGITLLLNSNEVRIYLGNNVTLDKCYMTIRYTKTSPS